MDERFDTDWNLDNYRMAGETDLVWQKRRTFMENIKSAYPEGRVVYLGLVYADILQPETVDVRSKYPGDTLSLVVELSSKLHHTYSGDNMMCSLCGASGGDGCRFM